MSANNKANINYKTKLLFAGRVLVKALVLFLLLNILFAWLNPEPALGKISIYNRLLPGRERLPYGDKPQKSYNLNLFNLDAMFASHELNGLPKPDDEFRILIIGDSSIWGFLLTPQDTLSSKINRLNLTTPDGRNIKAYNLGYPVMSLTKDLLILSYGLKYEPDLIVWAFTLESFPKEKQLFPPLLLHNPQKVKELNDKYSLGLDIDQADWYSPSFWEKTIVGKRRELADIVRLQIYGLLWAATGIDQYIPDQYTPVMVDLPDDDKFNNLSTPHLNAKDLSFNVLNAGIEMADGTPILLINEPIFISEGENSDIRYNFYYPRWAYDDYRKLLQEKSETYGWLYKDFWNSIPETEFTNSAIHLSPKGSGLFAQQIMDAVMEILQEEEKIGN